MKIKLTTELYDFLKKAALLYLPALGSLYFGLSSIWHLPSAENVIGSITAVDTFLGLVLGVSSSSYSPADNHDGVMNVVTSPDGTQQASMVLNGPAEEIVNKSAVTFKVNQVPLDSPPK